MSEISNVKLSIFLKFHYIYGQTSDEIGWRPNNLKDNSLLNLYNKKELR